MDNTFFISVVLPVYNAEKYLKSSIQSVLDQTHANFELIILNDGSTDDSDSIIKDFNDSRIVYVKHNNIGLAKTLNKGISLAKANYIARMDADDISLANRLEDQIKYINLNKNIILLGGGVIRIDDNGNHLSYDFPYTGSKIIKNLLLKKGNVFKHPSVIFRKDIVVKLGGYDEEINCYFEDYYLWAKIVRNGYEVDNLGVPVLKYRITPGSIMSSDHDQKFIDMMLRVVNTDEFSLADTKLLQEKKKLSKNVNIEELYKKRIYKEKRNNKNRLFTLIAFVIGNGRTFKFFVFLKRLISSVIHYK